MLVMFLVSDGDEMLRNIIITDIRFLSADSISSSTSLWTTGFIFNLAVHSLSVLCFF